MTRLGFIGCGNIARHHTGIMIDGVKTIRIVAAADAEPKALKAFGRDFGVTALFSDYDEMLQQADIDAVCVALPTSLHKRAVVKAAGRGKHVFCEKPMALSLKDCDTMIDACRKAGVVLMVGQVRRYDRDWGTWKRLVLSGAVGRPVLWRQLMGRDGPTRQWFLDGRMGGGPFMDGCVHNYDFANDVFGKPVEVVGSLLSLSQVSAKDTGTVILRYDAGDEMMLSWSWGLAPGVTAGKVNEILGPKGVIRFPGTFDDSELPDGFDQSTHGAYLVDLGKRKRLAKFPKKNMFAEEWKDFSAAIAKGREPVATGEIGREAVRVALAVLKAGESRKTVKIGER